MEELFYNQLNIRELKSGEEALIVDYFYTSTPEHLLFMGVDHLKLPERQSWMQRINQEHLKTDEQREYFYLLWMTGDEPVGHCNINHIHYGSKAFMHLHIWSKQIRRKGLGIKFIKLSLPVFFDRFKLEELFCQPKAANAAPNKILTKAGFKLINDFELTPGWINYHQKVTRYRITRKEFQGAAQSKG